MTNYRQLSIYEKNQLLKYGLQEKDLLAKGELPVEYLTGFVNFKNLDVEVNSHVLIPRVETEELVELVIKIMPFVAKQISYLEIGTGSGAISLALFNYFLHQSGFSLKKFVLTDISKDALHLAKENFLRLFGKEQIAKIQFLHSNLLASLFGQQFNVIVANLPYIPSSKINNLAKSVREYEPLLALNGGATGFDLINQLLKQILAKNLLDQNGKIFLEVDEGHDLTFIKTKFPVINQQYLITQFIDQFDRHRFLVLEKK
jgi:release factor glutamine methyltransferase